MAKRYRPVNREQPFLFPPDMRDWLPAGHPVWLVITVVEDHLDTSAFHALRRTGGGGGARPVPGTVLSGLGWGRAHPAAPPPGKQRLWPPHPALPVLFRPD